MTQTINLKTDFSRDRMTMPLGMEEAAEKGDTQKLLQYLAQGIHPDAQNDLGETALHCAALYNRGETIAALTLKHGANPEIKNHAGRTPLDIAHFADHRRAEVTLEQVIHGRGVLKENYPGITDEEIHAYIVDFAHGEDAKDHYEWAVKYLTTPIPD